MPLGLLLEELLDIPLGNHSFGNCSKEGTVTMINNFSKEEQGIKQKKNTNAASHQPRQDNVSFIPMHASVNHIY